MAGIIHVDAVTVEASSDHMLLIFESGGDRFRFRLPKYTAIGLRETVMRDAWQVLCAPDAEVVALSARLARAKRDRRAKQEGGK